MRKRIISDIPLNAEPIPTDWLNLDDLVDEVEITSEDPGYPIEAALLPNMDQGWRAADQGKQTIRLQFSQPQKIQRIQLTFQEPAEIRTQEYMLRWSQDNGQSFTEIVRQQWNFSPESSTTELEDHAVALSGVTDIELNITPDISGRSAIASLAKLQLS
jgi:hypothetical protein